MRSGEDLNQEYTRIEQLLERTYGIRAVRIGRVKRVYRVSTLGGSYYFKLVPFRYESRVAELHGLLNALRARGFRAAPPIPAPSGRYLVHVSADDWGYLQPEMPGRHADFDNTQHRVATVASVAYLHRMASGLPMSSLTQPMGLRLIDKFESKRGAFDRLRPEAALHCPDLQHLPDETVLGMTLWSKPSGPIQSCAHWLQFCHRDLAPHNVIVDGASPSVALIDFDLAGLDHPFVDLIQIANHSLTVSPRAEGLYADIVDVYRAVAGLDSTQEQWLWRLFAFPEVLIRSVMEWAKNGFPPAERDRILTAIDKEERRCRWLAEECPFRLY